MLFWLTVLLSVAGSFRDGAGDPCLLLVMPSCNPLHRVTRFWPAERGPLEGMSVLWLGCDFHLGGRLSVAFLAGVWPFAEARVARN